MPGVIGLGDHLLAGQGRQEIYAPASAFEFPPGDEVLVGRRRVGPGSEGRLALEVDQRLAVKIGKARREGPGALLDSQLHQQLVPALEQGQDHPLLVGGEGPLDPPGGQLMSIEEDLVRGLRAEAQDHRSLGAGLHRRGQVGHGLLVRAQHGVQAQPGQRVLATWVQPPGHRPLLALHGSAPIEALLGLVGRLEASAPLVVEGPGHVPVGDVAQLVDQAPGSVGLAHPGPAASLEMVEKGGHLGGRGRWKRRRSGQDLGRLAPEIQLAGQLRQQEGGHLGLGPTTLICPIATRHGDQKLAGQQLVGPQGLGLMSQAQGPLGQIWLQGRDGTGLGQQRRRQGRGCRSQHHDQGEEHGSHSGGPRGRWSARGMEVVGDEGLEPPISCV